MKLISTKEPAAQWAELKERFLNEIENIDNATPWADKEPDWWVEMSRVRDYIKYVVCVK